MERDLGWTCRMIHTSPKIRPQVKRALFLALSVFAVLSVAGITLVAAAAADENVTRASKQKPNVLVYIVDDWGWQDTSVPFWKAPTLWNTTFRTPTLERLAATGMKFTQAYACAVCSPSRTSIMTGQNAARHGVTNWTLNKDGETSHKTAQLNAPADWKRNGLQPDQPNIASILKKQGYFTIHAGKAHWGANDTPGSNPENLGFSVNIAGHAAGGPGHYHGENNYGNKEVGGHTRPWGIPGLEKYHGSDIHLTDATTMEANAALKQASDLKKPFYLYMAHYAVHAPIMEHQRFFENYEGKNYPGTTIPISRKEAEYASMVEGIDASLGELLDTIDELGQLDNTLVIVLSDNGGLTRHARGGSPYKSGANTHCWPLREGKGSAYEGGTRIPLIISWANGTGETSLRKPAAIPAGSVCDTPVIIEDIPMTVLDLVGGDELMSQLPQADGVSLMPLLNNPTDSRVSSHRPLVFHYPHQWTGRPQGGYQSHSSIRVGPWKAIYFYESSSWELYNLDEDIYESENLSSTNRSKLVQLAGNPKALLNNRGAMFPYNHKENREQVMQLPE